jgi:hypothetical protein
MKKWIHPLLFLLGWIPATLLAQPTMDLSELPGTWMVASAHHEAAPCEFQLTVLSVQADGQQIVVYVSDYQAQDEPISFTLQWQAATERWEYAFAQRGGDRFDLARLDHLWIQPEQTINGLRLHYQVKETDACFVADHWLLRQTPTSPGWACHLQEPLTELLSGIGYRIYGADWQPLTATQAFGTDQIGEELRFFAQYQNLLPMYETWCACTPFDLVVVGGIYPGSAVQVYGITWDDNEVRLYETKLDPESSSLLRGALRYRILPTPAVQ